VDSIWDELANSQPDGGVVIADNGVPPSRVAEYIAFLDNATGILEE
jgi:hypothetical protein